MKTKEEIVSFLEDNYSEDEFLLADGLETAFIGVGVQFNNFVAVYDYDKCITALKRMGMNTEDAHEWMCVNVIGAYVGEKTPIFLYRAPR